MHTWQAVVLGLVEGITEFLPVSSTGHLVIARDLIGLNTPEARASVDTLSIVIQGGAILAVAILYWPRFVSMFRGVMGLDGAGFRLLVNIGIAFLPAAVFGKLLDDVIEEHLFNLATVVAALMLGAVYMMGVEAWRTGRFSTPRTGRDRSKDAAATGAELDALTPGKALIIGLMQCVAMVPGTSRSMMTLTGGVLCGLRPRAAAEFSFLLGVPTLLAASLYKLYKNLSDSADAGTPNLFEQFGVGTVLVATVVAAASAAAAVKWLVGFLNRHGLTPFAWYRIVLGLVLIGLAMGGVIDVAR